MLYHFHKPLVPGGFVGVDIFFVISGFLITRNIWGEMLAGQFRFSDFYLRRIRRIAPAFLAMTAVTVVAGSFLLLPVDLLALARSALWGAFSLANVYFWRHLDTSYFAESSDQVPMLHTWSLGVEEQFYFFWPALLIVASLVVRKRLTALTLALLICVGSFACAELTNVVAQKFSYYMLPARAGELMVGALLAIWQTSGKGIYREQRAARWLAELLAVGGGGLIAFALVHLDDASAFPGINALYPCLGTALLIVAGGMQSVIVKALLTPRPMVLVGLVSYSLYLWHWPVLAYIRYFYGVVDGWHAAAAAVAIFVFSVLSYRFVEVPARRYRPAPLRQVAVLYAVPSLLIVGFAAMTIGTGGFKSLIESSSAYRAGLAETAPAYKYHYNCQLSYFDGHILDDSRCVVGPNTTQAAEHPKVLLWGDSEAAHYIGVLGQLAKADGFSFRNATLSSCPPVFGGDYGQGVFKAGCERFRPYIRKAILSGAYPVLVMSGAWTTYFRSESFATDLKQTIDQISTAGIKIVLIGEVPKFDGYDRNCDIRASRIGGGGCQDRQVTVDSGRASADVMLEKIAASRPGVTYLDLRSILCRDGTCSPYLDGQPVYYNATHLSMAGSWRIGEKLLQRPDAELWSEALVGHGLPNSLRSKVDKEEKGNRGILLPDIGGLDPGFQYLIRSQNRAGALDGHGAVVLEFRDKSISEATASIKRAMRQKHFDLASEGPSGAAIRLIFTRPGSPDISVNIGPLGTLSPRRPDSTGIAYIHW
ncbi:MAG: hypothetical protein ABT16_00260 [Rhodanobacter sp. SCN 65-17]|nr:MAG: hypothetical protein ABT16_00260 [Rhodanobacter sp. SCN 65-17]